MPTSIFGRNKKNKIVRVISEFLKQVASAFLSYGFEDCIRGHNLSGGGGAFYIAEKMCLYEIAGIKGTN